MTQNKSLYTARQVRNDEYYTRIEDIEAELKHYADDYFRDKVVLCNCNDGLHSNFWKYFHKHFKEKGMKHLIGISYSRDGYGCVYSYTGKGADEDENCCTVVQLRGHGDFREAECIEYLRGADIVVTNPPFSLLREYLLQLVQYKKNFIIVGTINIVVYKDVFPLIQSNKIWLGVKGWGITYFEVPAEQAEFFIKHKKEGSAYIKMDGAVLGRVSTIWVTNMEHNRRRERLQLTKFYNDIEYPQYDNYTAINVDRVRDIPKDYKGVMGVPISFLDKYNVEQFEIVGCTIRGYTGAVLRKHAPQYYLGYKRGCKQTCMDSYLPLMSADYKGGTLCTRDNSADLRQLYYRLFIKRK